MMRQLLCATLLIATSMAVAAGSLYRFNIDGKVVIHDRVPADLAPLGYEVLNSQGMVIKKVPRQLTKEEIAERDRKLQAEVDRKNRMDEQKRQDLDLLRLYATVADVDLALKRKTEDVSSHINMQELRITDLQRKLEKSQEAAANIERSERDVPPELKLEIAQHKNGIEDAKKQIHQRNLEMDALKTSYSTIRKRIHILQYYPPGTLLEDVDFSTLPPSPESEPGE